MLVLDLINISNVPVTLISIFLLQGGIWDCYVVV